MIDFQIYLSQRFSGLRDARKGSVFFVEHGLGDDELEDLREVVRASLRVHPLESDWWDKHDLALLVAAAEVGYRYRGAGTDFWPLLEEELRVELPPPRRQRLKDLFENATGRVRGVRPPSTAWANAFHLIVWPIAHALLPVEFHRPFAMMLANLRASVGEAEDATLYRAICVAAQFPSARFATLLRDVDLIVALTRCMLGQRSGEFSAEILDRLFDDLEADAVARRGVAVARSIQRASRATQGVLLAPNLKEIRGSLRLRRANNSLMLEAAFPPLDADATVRLRASLRRRRFAPQLWGVTTRVPSDQLLSGLPFALKLTALPSPDAPLFPDLHLDGLEPADLALLHSFHLHFAPPTLFAVSADGEVARQVRGTDVTGHRNYWLLCEGAARPGGLPVVGELGPLCCLEIDPERDVGAQALAQLGYSVKFGVSVRFAGPPPVRREDALPAFIRGEHRLLVPRDLSDQASLRVALNGHSCVTGASEVVRVAVGGGEQVLEVSSESDSRRYPFLGVESVPPPLAAVRVMLRSEERTVGALLAGRLCFIVDSFVTLGGLQLSVELEAAGKLFSATGTLEPLPQVVSAEHPILRKLLEEDVLEFVSRSDSATLRVRVGHLAVASWSLERTLRPCWWDFRVGTRLLSEAGPLQFGVICANDPVRVPAERLPGDDAYLLAPVGLDLAEFGPAARFTSMCLVPTRVQLALPSVIKPGLLRRRRGGGLNVGLEELIEAYLRWALAETQNRVGDLRRRQVSMLLDSWVTELCCGAKWSEVEQTLPARDSWALLEGACRELALGHDSYLSLTEAQESMVRRLAIEEIRRSMPMLWSQVGPPSELGSEEYEALDRAFASAYSALAAICRARGEEDLADQLDEADPGDDPALWDRALGRVRDAIELRELATMLLPSNSAQHLMSLNVGDLTVDEVADELVAWSKSSRTAFAGTPPSRETLRAIYALWVEPELALTADWHNSLDTLLAERAVARAVRYLAVRARDARRGAV